jgi:hypothetical protein
VPSFSADHDVGDVERQLDVLEPELQSVSQQFE